MRRLNDSAYEMLTAEVKRLVKGPLEEVRKDIVLRRLTKFRLQEGTPLTYAELKAEIEDVFPEFDDKVLKKAARVNRGLGILGRIKTVAISTAVAAGSLWLVNLPYPMIRWPVSRVAPILLLPSFMSMDHNYRQAISLVQQADQLVNQATSAQDIELGAERVQQSQKHLDRLPVWFLGYYPQAYCSWISCTWRFTYDEFEIARKDIGRMEAQLFQEQNALDGLDAGIDAVEAAQQQYEDATSPSEKTDATVAWQAGIDTLNEIPPETLAGRIAQSKLKAYRRDLEEVTGTLAGGNRAATLIQAAKEFAWTASTEAQDAPFPPEVWQRIAGLWQQAIDRLEQVPVEDSGYTEAQRILAEYQNKLGVVEARLIQEQRSQAALESAQFKNVSLTARVEQTQLNTAQYASELQSILNDLSKVEEGTTVYESAQQLIQAIQARLQQIDS